MTRDKQESAGVVLFTPGTCLALGLVGYCFGLVPALSVLAGMLILFGIANIMDD